jgi:hypothetical protein
MSENAELLARAQQQNAVSEQEAAANRDRETTRHHDPGGGPSFAFRCRTPRAPVNHFDDSTSCPLNFRTLQPVMGWAASARVVSV